MIISDINDVSGISDILFIQFYNSISCIVTDVLVLTDDWSVFISMKNDKYYLNTKHFYANSKK